MSTLASVVIYDIYSNLPAAGIPGRMFYVSGGGTNAGNGYRDNGSSWDLVITPGGGSSPLTTKGDIFGFDSADARIPVGVDGEVLTADSSQALGVKWASAAGGIGILGTAVFSASGGTISGLVIAGNITSVTRTAIGQYVVAISGSPANYIIQMTTGDPAQIAVIQVDPATSYTSSGFTVQVNAPGVAYDPALVFITVIG